MEESIKPEISIEQKPLVYPSIAERIKSSVIDGVFIIFIMSVIAMLFDEFENVPNWIRATLFIGLFFIYEPVAQTLGYTLGNYIMEIRVRSETFPEQRINIIQAFMRFGFKSLLGWLSFFTVRSNPQRRAIHDMMSGSVMLYAE